MKGHRPVAISRARYALTEKIKYMIASFLAVVMAICSCEYDIPAFCRIGGNRPQTIQGELSETVTVSLFSGMQEDAGGDVRNLSVAGKNAAIPEGAVLNVRPVDVLLETLETMQELAGGGTRQQLAGRLDPKDPDFEYKTLISLDPVILDVPVIDNVEQKYKNYTSDSGKQNLPQQESGSIP